MARVGLIAGVIAVAALVWRLGAGGDEPDERVEAPVARDAAVDPEAPPPRSIEAVRERQTARLRVIRAGLERLRAARGDAGPVEPGGEAPPMTPDEKRAATNAWKERISKALSDDLHPLVVECLDLVELPDREVIDLRAELEISGLPGVGSVVHSARIIEDETNVKIPELSECFRESAYVIEVEPPPIGLEDTWGFGIRRVGERTMFLTTNIWIDPF